VGAREEADQNGAGAVVSGEVDSDLSARCALWSDQA
jgi:hypothetical protein